MPNKNESEAKDWELNNRESTKAQENPSFTSAESAEPIITNTAEPWAEPKG
jgi:hypothetical protein